MKAAGYKSLVSWLAWSCSLFIFQACGGSGTKIDKDFCESLGLEYRQTADGKGYCYGSGIDCAQADDGTSCDDGDACTVADVCAAGVCAGTSLPGLDDENACTQDSCDPANGEITHDPVPLNGTSCDDGDVCSSGDACRDGICAGDYTVDVNGDTIDDGDDCTRDFCDADGTRSNQPYTPEEAVELGLGGITYEDIANPCLQYECALGSGDSPHMNSLDRVDCSDPDAGRTNGDCVNWTCQNGQCAAIVNAEVVQNAPVQGGLDLNPACRMRECNTRTGLVDYVVDSDKVGRACDDGNGCTFSDICHMYGQCAGVSQPHGTPCSDGSACTVGDYCHDAACVSGRDLFALANEIPDPDNPDQDDQFRDPSGIIAGGVECLEYACDSIRGVVIAPVADGLACDDGNPCTATSACAAGECVGVRDGTNDGQQCMSPTNECEEGSCDKGVCVDFHPVSDLRVCQGQNPCREHHCEDVAGIGRCVDGANLTDGIVCGQVSDCQDQICQAGACLADPNLTTHLGDPCGDYDTRCNAPACDANANCLVNPVADGIGCSLKADDLVGLGLAAEDLVCNVGYCRDVSGVGVSACLPQVSNEGGGCVDANPCDGASMCQSGICAEKYTTDDPNDPDYDNALPTSDSATPCEMDGDPSTVGRCNYRGECVELSRLADDTNECSRPVFNAASGTVDLEFLPDGTRCNVVPVNPCLENHGVCLGGECHVTTVPDGSPCDVADLELPAPEDLPAGHRLECYAEVCLAGQCVVERTLQNGDECDDGETTCTAPGACDEGFCRASDTPRGYGETCSPPAATGIVDLDGRPVLAADSGCYVAFECSETGSCSVAVGRAPELSPCDLGQNGNSCDGWCNAGACEAHVWGNVPNSSCDDGNPCTADQCNGQGGCAHLQFDGPTLGCEGVDPQNPCADLECVGGACTAVNDNTNLCDDGSICTLDECISGQCVGTANLLSDGMPCGDADDINDGNCMLSLCASGVCVTDAGFEPAGAACGSEGQCLVRGFCDGAGNCSGSISAPDGTNCDTNGIPCDEGCLDIDGPLGGAPSNCVAFADFFGLVTAGEMAANGNPLDADGWEERACRQLYDTTYDPDSPGSGNACTRYVCYFGACRPWNEALPIDSGLAGNPENGQSCTDAGACTLQGVCLDNACTSYHNLADGTPCGEPSCDAEGDRVVRPVCQSGACTSEEVQVDSCTKGVAACLDNACFGGACMRTCRATDFDYLNVFEDIAFDGTPHLLELASPYDTNVHCGDFTGSGAASEAERMACDDGAILLDLAGQLGFVSPDGPGADSEGFWFFNRRYRYISISANGVVLMNKDNPLAPADDSQTLFAFANVGGSVFDPDAGDQPGDPVNDGSSTAQARAFFDDLTFISDPREQPPADSSTPYGNFTRFGEIYTKHMPGPDGQIENGTQGNFDDYLIVQWHRAAFYGCAENDSTRSIMTLEMKWWPASGMIAFVYPKETNFDGTLVGHWCQEGRVNGADASIGLVDEDGSPKSMAGENGLLVFNDSGPGSDDFDGYYMFWPKSRPADDYAVKGMEWFDDLSIYDAQTGGTRGKLLSEVSDCDDCCQRVDFDQPLFIDGRARNFMNVCADGYIHFLDYGGGGDASLNAGSATLLDGAQPVFKAAPFWSDLRMEQNDRSKVYWLDESSGSERRVTVQWERADYDYAINAFGLLLEEQEMGEPLCTNNIDDDSDGLTDCDDTSCACAAACAGHGCGLTFEAIFHAGTGMIEFRYLSPWSNFEHARGSTSGVAIGFEQAVGGGHGIDLLDGFDGGDMLPTGVLLDTADVDEQVPGSQLNILLPQAGYMTPYGY
jgi:hypothetical protein